MAQRPSRTAWSPRAPLPPVATVVCAPAPLPDTAKAPALDEHATDVPDALAGMPRRKHAAASPASNMAGTNPGTPYNAFEPSLAWTSRAHDSTALTPWTTIPPSAYGASTPRLDHFPTEGWITLWPPLTSASLRLGNFAIQSWPFSSLTLALGRAPPSEPPGAMSIRSQRA